MLSRILRPDWREHRDWRRPWDNPPGFFFPNCVCCPGAASQNYYCMGGQQLGGGRFNQNYQWSSGWTAKAVLSAARDSMAASTPSSTNPLYTYGGIDNVTFGLTESDSYAPDTWSTNTAMSSPGRSLSAGVAISSLCYSWGGQNTSAVTIAVNDQMTPGSPSTWATKTAIPATIKLSAAAAISTKGYSICGFNGTTTVATNREYDPSGDSWASKTACPAPTKDGLAGWTISSRIYVMYGIPDTTRRTDGYVVDTWSSFATAPNVHPASGSNFSDDCAGASIDASGVGWETGGENGGNLDQHSEYVPNAWTARTAIPVAICNAVASPA